MKKLKIIEYMTLVEYRQNGISDKKGYKCRQQQLMGDYVYVEWWKYE